MIPPRPPDAAIPRYGLLVSFVLLALLVPSLLNAATNVLIPTGSTWRYLDDGSDQDTRWRSTSFDDTAWATGPAELGYGETGQNTQLSYGGDTNNRHITYYFRKTFTVPANAAYLTATLRVLRDDGAVVYLNGTNVFRSNMPSGAIDYRTLALANVTGTAENTYFATNLPGARILPGTNTLAVEIHQYTNNSGDLSFNLELLGITASQPDRAEIVRGPYLQQGTPTNVLVRWRTDAAAVAKVWFGITAGDLNQTTHGTAATNEHIVRLEGLLPSTRYYYAIGDTNGPLVGDASYSFVTAPVTNKATRVWVIGDSGTANNDARAVYQAYTNLAGSSYTDLWLMLGDNAYNTGTDAQYQSAVFEMYPELLRQTVLWPTIGNHDTAFSANPATTLPYFRIFSLPMNGEAGGVPSGTEKYYSFDYADIHFVCLDAMASDRASDGPMLTWLAQDLAANERDWVIAFWHHPPYTKGSHDSDVEGDLVEVRENFLPILESYGVDLVLCGHSHCYERSYLIRGHYGFSGTFDDSMKKNGGSGREDEGGAYIKSTSGPDANEGTVYVVAGSSGQATFGTMDHPIMFFDEIELGSLVLDIDGPVLQARFLRETGVIDDYFTIRKGSAAKPVYVIAHQPTEQTVKLSWNAQPGHTYRVERTTDLAVPNWTPSSPPLMAVNAQMEWSTSLDRETSHLFFRVVSLGQ